MMWTYASSYHRHKDYWGGMLADIALLDERMRVVPLNGSLNPAIIRS